MSKKKKRRHRLGGPSPQNGALGQPELIVRTVAQDPNVQLRLNPAGVAKMSDVLLRFAEPILDRLAPLDEKKATLLFAITAWNYCLISSEEQAHMRWELRHIFKFNHVVDFRAAFSGSYLRFFAKYACPGSRALSPFFEHPFARLGCFGRDR